MPPVPFTFESSDTRSDFFQRSVPSQAQPLSPPFNVIASKCEQPKDGLQKIFDGRKPPIREMLSGLCQTLLQIERSDDPQNGSTNPNSCSQRTEMNEEPY